MQKERRWKAVALLATGIVIGVAVTGTPAGAHVAGWAHNWKAHIKPKADKRYYTKATANARFLPGGNLAGGRTIRGFYAHSWNAVAADEIHETSIAFGWTLSSAPTAHFVPTGAPAPAGCPGTAALPEAAPGHLCVYEATASNVYTEDVCSVGSCTGATRFGAQLRANSVGGGPARSRGTWAVTTP